MNINGFYKVPHIVLWTDLFSWKGIAVGGDTQVLQASQLVLSYFSKISAFYYI